MFPESSIFLLKDFIIPKQQTDWLYISSGTLQDAESRFQCSSASRSLYAKEILTFLKEARDQKLYSTSIQPYCHIAFGLKNLEINGTQQVLRIAFHPEFMKLIDRISSKYFIRVIVKSKDIEIADHEVYCRRMDGTETLEQRESTISNWFTSVVFNSKEIFEDDFSADVIVGWCGRTATINAAYVMQNLFETESSKDLTINAGDGAIVKCHKIIFEAHSDVFAAMLSSRNGMKEFQTGVIEMKENSKEGVTQLIKYLYGLELDIDNLSCEVTMELFKLAHKYELRELHVCIGEVLFEKAYDWYSPDVLLELYFHVKNLDELKHLQDHSLKMVLKLSSEVRKCERFKELNKSDPGACAGFLWALVDYFTRSDEGKD